MLTSCIAITCWLIFSAIIVRSMTLHQRAEVKRKAKFLKAHPDLKLPPNELMMNLPPRLSEPPRNISDDLP